MTKARCRCGAVRFELPNLPIAPEGCSCQAHRGSNGPPFHACAVYPMRGIRFVAGRQFCPALNQQEVASTQVPLCMVCGDAAILDGTVQDVVHVYKAIFQQFDGEDTLVLYTGSATRTVPL